MLSPGIRWLLALERWGVLPPYSDRGGSRLLHLINKDVYTPEDWILMQHAHASASLKLGRDPIAHENSLRLARTVMNLFNKGMRNQEEIAARASEEEAAATSIASDRQ